jgi:hypothetical protein
MATLSQIATRIKDLAVVYAPKRTGNLKRQLDTYNRPSGMIKEDKVSRTIEFSIDVSPPGAEYGMWWNDPTVSKTVKGRQEVNFADRALNNPEIDKMIDDYINKVVDEIGDALLNEIDKEFKDLK